jgi:hypothetical protein
MAERMPRWGRAVWIVVLAATSLVLGTVVMIGLFILLNIWIFHIPLTDR